MKRRDFLGWLTRIAGTALGGFVLYPVARYLVPPPTPEAATRRVLAAKKDELAPGTSKTFAFGPAPGLLVRTADGRHVLCHKTGRGWQLLIVRCRHRDVCSGNGH